MSAGHSHGPGRGHAQGGDEERRTAWALGLTGTFLVAEVVGGLLSGSLALLADAGHMLTDAVALALTLVAFRVSRRPADARRTYGYGRVQILAALINALTLVGIVVWITYEAVSRLNEPVVVLGGPMLVIAVLGLVINIVSYMILLGGNRANLNLRGAAAHVMGDLLGSVGAILAAIVILLTGWTPADPLLSVLVALLIARSAWSLLRKSWHVLLEGTPDWLDVPALKGELAAAVPGVLDVHHVHAWSLTPESPLMTLHVQIATDADHDVVLQQVGRVLTERYRIGHATIQVERNPCAPAPGSAGH
jgi:cobalt-zinc-cadmium efflux system protein